MSAKLTYLITGANRGIGLGLTATLLQRPGTTVIATVRDIKTTDCSPLKGLPLASGSVLYIESLEVAEEKSLLALRKSIEEHGVKTIDTIIANAGTGTQFSSCGKSSVASIKENFEVNTLGPILLYQSFQSFLVTSSPKFIVISSILGSIDMIKDMGAAPTLAYGISKAGVNFFARKLHFEEKELCTLSVHPGWAKTGNGQAFADAIGVEAPPLGVEESIQGVLKQIDELKKETTSGTFVSYDGSVLAY